MQIGQVTRRGLEIDTVVILLLESPLLTANEVSDAVSCGRVAATVAAKRTAATVTHLDVRSADRATKDEFAQHDLLRANGLPHITSLSTPPRRGRG